jgi:superfamily II DNA or RNA helicase
MTLPLPPGQTPRAWQLEALAAITSSWRAGLSSVVVSAATGTGKGSLLAGLARRAEAKGSRVLILVHRRELVEDLAARVAAIPGPPPGIVQARRDEGDRGIVIASVQSLAKRLAGLQPYDLVVTDEAHHAVAPTYQLVYRAVEEARRRAGKPERYAHLGMTATPFRTGGEGVSPITGDGAPFQAIAYEHGITQAIAAGDLVPPRGTAIETHLDLSAVEMRGGDYDERGLERVVDVDARNAHVAQLVAERAAGRSFLAFAVSVAHAERLAAAFRGAGLAVEAVWGNMPADLRAQRIAEYAAGRLQGLVSRDLLFEGFDSPRTSLLVACRPTRSQIIAWQLVGRGLRLYPGKVDCEILDFVGFLRVLDFGSAPEADEGDAKRQSAAPWVCAVGDRVVPRYAEGDPPVGVVVEVDEPEGPVFVRVRWSVDTVRQCSVADLRRAPLEVVPDEAVPVEVRGHTSYSVSLLPGQDVERARGWYSPRASEGRAEWSSYGWREGVQLFVAIALPVSLGWTLWRVRLPANGMRAAELEGGAVHGAVARKIADGADLLDLQRQAERWLDGERARHLPVTSPPMRELAAPALLARLRAAGDVPPPDGLAKGEAWARLAHAQGRRAVEDARRELRRRFVR